MSRLILALTAIALFAVSSLPAKADFSLLRWNNGWCQIWDHRVPTPMPPAGEFKVLGKRLATFGDAFDALERAVQTRACGLEATNLDLKRECRPAGRANKVKPRSAMTCSCRGNVCTSSPIRKDNARFVSLR
jgi:hypothetical protein